MLLDLESWSLVGTRDFIWVVDFMSHENREVHLAGLVLL